MFETSGVITQKIIEELQPKYMPHMTRNTLIMAAIFIFLATRYPFGSWGFTLIMLCAAWPFYLRQAYIRRYIMINMEAIRRFTGTAEMPVTTSFTPDTAVMLLPKDDRKVTIAYGDLQRIFETDSIYCLSSVSQSAVYVFKDQLSEQEKKELFAMLRGKDTQIPLKQFPY